MTQATEPEILRAAMRELPADIGALLEAYYFEHATLEELSHSAQIPVDTVRARLSLGRAALHRLLEHDARWVALAEAGEQKPRGTPGEAAPGLLERLRGRLGGADDDDGSK